MGVIEGRTWLEQLHGAECWRLVAGEEIDPVEVTGRPIYRRPSST